jgi:hypothetical protein
MAAQYKPEESMAGGSSTSLAKTYNGKNQSVHLMMAIWAKTCSVCYTCTIKGKKRDRCT